jgi:hypothetical protein
MDGLLEEVRLALKPLVDRGIVLDIQESRDLASPRKRGFLATVNAPEPRGYLPEVRHLLYEAGLTELANVSLESGLSD